MKYLKAIWKFLIGVKDALALILLLVIFVGIFAASRGSVPPAVPDRGALVLELNGFIVDQATETDPFDLISGGGDIVPEHQSRDIITAIDSAAKDQRITALVLQLDNFMGGGLANLQAVRAALLRFKSTGKPIYAYATAYLDDGYYLASAADEAWVNPLGAVMLTGPGGTNLYFAEALKKLQVDVQVFKVGTYKSAVEPFIRNEASPEARAANQAIVDTLWGHYLADVRAVRPKVDIPALLKDMPAFLASHGGDFARLSVKTGLVDRIGTYVDMGNQLRKKIGKGDEDLPGVFSQIAMEDYLAAMHPVRPNQGGPKIGVIYVSGEIVDGHAPRGVAGGDTISELVTDALRDEDIKALVLRVDSPGGSVMASEKIRQALVTAKADGLPVVASFGPVAASGGYWIATAADEIYAAPTTITGSIGVFAIIPSFQRTLNRFGIYGDSVKSTPYSGEPDIINGMSEDSKLIAQASVNDIYRRFTGIVATARRMPVAEVEKIAEGRVWAGSTAKDIKLVDRYGDLDTAIAAAARRAGLDPKTVQREDIELKPSLPFQILSELMGNKEEADVPQGGQDAWSQMLRISQHRQTAAVVDAITLAQAPGIQLRCMSCAGLRPPAHVPHDKAVAKMVQAYLRGQ